MLIQHERKKIGLVAGWGKFPVVVAETLMAQGYSVYGLGIRGHADPVLKNICDHFSWFGMARMGAQVRYLRRNGVAAATMAGKIFKTRIFKKFHWIRHLPDWTFVKHFYPVLTRKRDRKDDTLLTMVTELYADGGVTFLPATDFAPELLIPAGVLTRKPPTDAQYRDIEFGWNIAKQMGGLDIGQSVAVKNQAVLAVEAIEGTDACIRRAGELCPAGGFTVVKTAKPNQDMRFDVPTIGCGTIETLAASGGKFLAIEAEKTIVLEKDKVIEAAEKKGITLVAVSSDSMNARQPHVA